MKRKFIKILPIAVAVLFATSCSKDDVDNTVKTPQEIVQENVDNTINDNVETSQEIVQENDDNTVKTITITGKVSQESLSKVSLTDLETKNLKFDGGEEFLFNDNDNHVWGQIKITDASSGSYTAKLYFKGEGDNLVGEDAVFTASLNTDPNPISSTGYTSLNEAVQNAYYTITFKVKKVDNTVASTGYTYQMYDASEGNEDLVVNIASAFIHAEATKKIKVKIGGEDQTIEVSAGYHVLSTSVKMGSGNDIVAGKIYKVN